MTEKGWGDGPPALYMLPHILHGYGDFLWRGRRDLLFQNEQAPVTVRNAFESRGPVAEWKFFLVLFLSRKRTEGLPGAAAPGLLALDGGNAVDVGENLTQGTGGGVVLLHVTVVFHHGELLSCVERLTSD